MEITKTFSFTAPPEVLYNSLTNPERAARWLPAGVRVESLDRGRLRIVAGSTAAEYEVATAAADLRLSWRSLATPDLHGTAAVEDGPAGGSRVRVAMNAPDAGPGVNRIRNLLDETMHHLQRDVSDNFNAG